MKRLRNKYTKMVDVVKTMTFCFACRGTHFRFCILLNLIPNSYRASDGGTAAQMYAIRKAIWPSQRFWSLSIKNWHPGHLDPIRQESLGQLPMSFYREK